MKADQCITTIVPMSINGLPNGSTLQASYYLQGSNFMSGFESSDSEDQSAKISVEIPLN